MKTAAMILAAGIASSAAAQDITITVNPTPGAESLTIGYNGGLVVQQLWSDISVRLTGDGPINVTSQQNVYTSVLTPAGATITGNGTGVVTFVGAAPGALLGAPVNSADPFSPFTFTNGGTAGGLVLELFSQNTSTFVLPPFGNPINMMNANGSLGPLTFEIVYVPAPASAALLGLGGLAAIRRRR